MNKILPSTTFRKQNSDLGLPSTIFRKPKNGAGFTLIELLVITAIISLMSALIIPNLRFGEEQFAVQNSAHKLAQDLRIAQEMAMSASEFNEIIPQGGYGIYFEKIKQIEKLEGKFVDSEDIIPGKEIHYNLKILTENPD